MDKLQDSINIFVAVFLGCTSTGRVGLCFLWSLYDLKSIENAIEYNMKDMSTDL